MLVLGVSGASAQSTAKKPASPARLELKMEVASTNDDGSPQALRFTLTNVGDVAMVLPEPSIHCSGIYGQINVQPKIIAGTPEGNGLAMACAGTSGTDGRRTIVETIRDSWFHLQPGEFLVFTGDGRQMLARTEGLITYEYWAEYKPPVLNDADKAKAESAGYHIPSELVVSAHLTYTERWPVEERDIVEPVRTVPYGAPARSFAFPGVLRAALRRTSARATFP